MVTQYSLTLVNNSSSPGTFALFQRPPTGSTDVFPVAWFARATQPHTQVTVQWTEDHSFVHGETGVLRPGVTFNASQIVAADPMGQNYIRLSNDLGGGSCFSPPDTCGSTGSLTIEQGRDVAAERSGVGIGMSGAGTFVVQATPNRTLAFTPHPNYWVAFAEHFQAGEVLDLDNISGEVEVTFPGSTTSRTVTLQPNNLLVVS